MEFLGAFRIHKGTRIIQRRIARPLRFLVGFPAGGGADIVARIIAPWLSKQLGQQVIVENRPGASTGLAIQAAVNSPPAGYTLVHFGASSLVNSIMHSTLPFDLRRDVTLVAGLVEYPMVLVVNPSFSAKNVADLIAEAKAKPATITMASFGTGSASHLAGELFKMMAGINMVHVPYRGGAPMIGRSGRRTSANRLRRHDDSAAADPRRQAPGARGARHQ
jgi:tripartite-type tricarboxylate transporter receptor subunit TctC